MKSGWARWRLKSPSSRLFTQPFIQEQIKENIKAPRHWPLCGEFTGDRWIPRTNVQYRGKCFHLITSSCLYDMMQYHCCTLYRIWERFAMVIIMLKQMFWTGLWYHNDYKYISAWTIGDSRWARPWYSKIPTPKTTMLWLHQICISSKIPTSNLLRYRSH